MIGRIPFRASWRWRACPSTLPRSIVVPVVVTVGGVGLPTPLAHGVIREAAGKTTDQSKSSATTRLRPSTRTSAPPDYRPTSPASTQERQPLPARAEPAPTRSRAGRSANRRQDSQLHRRLSHRPTRGRHCLPSPADRAYEVAQGIHSRLALQLTKVDVEIDLCGGHRPKGHLHARSGQTRNLTPSSASTGRGNTSAAAGSGRTMSSSM